MKHMIAMIDKAINTSAPESKRFYKLLDMRTDFIDNVIDGKDEIKKRQLWRFKKRYRKLKVW